MADLWISSLSFCLVVHPPFLTEHLEDAPMELSGLLEAASEVRMTRGGPSLSIKVSGPFHSFFKCHATQPSHFFIFSLIFFNFGIYSSVLKLVYQAIIATYYRQSSFNSNLIFLQLLKVGNLKSQSWLFLRLLSLASR